MEAILEMIHPAGVYAEMSVISGRLNMPWDRITLEWTSAYSVKWHTLFDAAENFSSGSVILQDRFYDGSIRFDGEYNFNSMKVIRSVTPTDLTFRDVTSDHYNKYTCRKKIKLSNHLYFDGRYNFSGMVEGARVGLSVMAVTRRVVKQVTAAAAFDGAWRFDERLAFSGEYTAYQPGVETYPVEGV
jgi:hypothetical protein